MPIIAFNEVDENQKLLADGTFKSPCLFDEESGKFEMQKFTILNSDDSEEGFLLADMTIGQNFYHDHECREYDHSGSFIPNISATFELYDDLSADLYIDYSETAESKCSADYELILETNAPDEVGHTEENLLLNQEVDTHDFEGYYVGECQNSAGTTSYGVYDFQTISASSLNMNVYCDGNSTGMTYYSMIPNGTRFTIQEYHQDTNISNFI